MQYFIRSALIYICLIPLLCYGNRLFDSVHPGIFIARLTFMHSLIKTLTQPEYSPLLKFVNIYFVLSELDDVDEK